MNRECRNDAGQAKRRYATRRDAKNALRRFQPADKDLPQPYRCQECGWFHLGHYPDNPRTRARLRDRHRGEAAS